MTAAKVSQLLAGFAVVGLVLAFIYRAWTKAVNAWLASWESLAEKAFRPTVTLYCWPHKANHTLPADDVERIVYALGGIAVDARGTEPIGCDPMPQPDCPLSLLRLADDSEGYAEHVEQGFTCRFLGEEWTP